MVAKTANREPECQDGQRVFRMGTSTFRFREFVSQDEHKQRQNV